MSVLKLVRGEVAIGRSLQECEAVIERGLHSFAEVGQALAEISKDKYREAGYDTIAAYCQGRWGMSRFYAHRLIDGAEVAAVLLPMGNIPSERVARELVPLRDEPEKLERFWGKVVEAHGEKPTAKQVREAVKAATPPRRGVADEEYMFVTAIRVHHKAADQVGAEAW